MRKTLLLMALCCSAANALAQMETGAPRQDDIALDTYLDMLGRIAPAARTGADVYLATFQQRCGRPLTVIELRRAIAMGAGEPVLMAMMRAASQNDAATLQRLSDAVPCAKRP